MQRLHNVKKWNHVAAGSAMNFEETKERKLRLDVNSAGPATLFYVDGDGEATLLGLVHGRDVLEFATHGGTFSIAVEDNDVWVHTIDGENIAYVAADAVTFTKLVERRTRNPEVEMMRREMQTNFQRLLDAQKNELVRVLDQRERAAAAAAAKPAAASDGGGSAPQPEPGKPASSDGGDKPGDDGDGTKAAS